LAPGAYPLWPASLRTGRIRRGRGPLDVSATTPDPPSGLSLGRDTREGDRPRPTKRSRWLIETAVTIVVVVAVALLLRTFVVQTFSIPSVSMTPTLQVGDRIVVNKLSYVLHGVGRGDIVVFARPPQEHCAGPPVADLVKRVIGLPGETISLSGNGHVLIDGTRLKESWLPASRRGTTYPGPPGTPYNLDHPYTIPSHDFFVMGDFRDDSCDSRFWGPIPKSLIVGKVDVRVWPLSAFRFF
jgi:signal peptidase I